MRSSLRRGVLPFVGVCALAAAHDPATPRQNAIVVEVAGLEGAVLSSITPTVKIRATREGGDLVPVALGVRIALSQDPTATPLVDTLVPATDSAEISVSTPLPSGSTVFFTAVARTGAGPDILSAAPLVRRVPDWVTLVFPNAPGGAILADRSPEFIWSSASVNIPPGPWAFDFTILPTAGGPAPYSTRTSDTSVTVPFPLELNTSYRWSVTASLQNQSSTLALSRSSFVIVDEATPRATLLYQTFPNPFPSAGSPFACIWFDLHTDAIVTLDVLDIRSNVVRRVFPAYGSTAPLLPAGRYGRQVNSESGCTGEYKWDGTDDSGRAVIPGVYLLRMRTGGRDFVKRMVFRGL